MINSCLSKVLTSILNSRLDKYVQDNSIMNKFQIGFKKKARTADHIFVLRTLIEKYVKRFKKPLFACFVDFKKAFDSVWHKGLYYKLLRQNIRGKIFDLIMNMYENSSASIKVDNDTTESFHVTTGVKQGEIMSPLLFNLFTNDLPDTIPVDKNTPFLDASDIRCLLYADDLVLLSLSAVGLQNSINKLGSYCKRWHLEVNTKKTKVVKFSGNGHKCIDRFYLNGTLLDNVQNYRYLGIVLNASGSFSQAKQTLANKARKALFKLRSNISGHDFNPMICLRLFDHLLKPICLYGSEIWGADNFFKYKSDDVLGTVFDKLIDKQPAEKIHLSFCKYILGIPRRSCINMVRGELGRFPLFK